MGVELGDCSTSGTGIESSDIDLDFKNRISVHVIEILKALEIDYSRSAIPSGVFCRGAHQRLISDLYPDSQQDLISHMLFGICYNLLMIS